MQDNLLMKIFGYIGFTISMVFTIVLMTSQASVWWGILLMLLTAVFLEFCKCVAFHKAIYEKKLGAFIIGFTLLFASVIASLSYMYNQQGEIKDNGIKGSVEYDLKLQTINTNKRLIEQKFKMIEELPENYKTKKNRIRNEIAELQAENNSINLQDVQVIEIKGYSRFLGTITNFINKMSGSKLKTDFIEFIFFGILSILFEFCAVWLLSETEKEESKNNLVQVKAKVKQPESKPQAIKKETIKKDIVENETIVKKEKFYKLSDIDFTDKSFTKKECKAYLKEMYDTCENEFSKGYKKLQSFVNANNKDMNMTQANALKIKHFLESAGVLKTEGVKTKIVRKVKV